MATSVAPQRRFLEAIAEIAATGAWADDGARDLAQWLWMRYGISDWKARRLIDAATALPTLPAIAGALERGDLGIDKVVELARFATVETEDGLVPWAQRVSAGRIRHEGDVVRRAEPDEATRDDAGRSLTWAFRDEGRRFEMHADLPAAQGAVVAKAIDRVAAAIPLSPTSRVIVACAGATGGRAGRLLFGAARDRTRPRAGDGRTPRAGRDRRRAGGRRDRGRRRGTPLDPRTAALRRPRRDRARGRRGPRDRHRTHHAGPTAVAAPAGPLPRRWMPVPRVRHARRSPRRTTSCSGATEARTDLDNLVTPLLVAPQARARVRLVDQGQRRGRSPLVPARRRAVRGRSYVGARADSRTRPRRA